LSSLVTYNIHESTNLVTVVETTTRKVHCVFIIEILFCTVKVLFLLQISFHLFVIVNFNLNIV